MYLNPDLRYSQLQALRAPYPTFHLDFSIASVFDPTSCHSGFKAGAQR